MFTGLIQKIGTLNRIERQGREGTLSLTCSAWTPALSPGESLSVHGACLTLREASTQRLVFDLLSETLQRTCLGQKRPGARLHLERALRASDFLGGHVVTGHVDGVGRVRSMTPTGRDWILEVGFDPKVRDGLVPKGSVAIDGVSLTVVDLHADGFSVHLIPFTWKETAFYDLKRGDLVNLEFDVLGKYARRTTAAQESAPLTLEDLQRAGWDAGADG